MAKNEETVDRQTRENEAIAERVHYTHRLVGMHECAPAPPPVPPDTAPVTDEPASHEPAPHESAAGQEVVPPQAQAQSERSESSELSESSESSEPAETLRCPQCGAANPAAMNQSDDRQSYRCDQCAYLWSAAHTDTAEDDMPPVPSIGAQGG